MRVCLRKRPFSSYTTPLCHPERSEEPALSLPNRCFMVGCSVGSCDTLRGFGYLIDGSEAMKYF